MLMTALQILATPVPPPASPLPRVMFPSSVTRGSCNKNVFSECDSGQGGAPGGTWPACAEKVPPLWYPGAHTQLTSAGAWQPWSPVVAELP